MLVAWFKSRTPKTKRWLRGVLRAIGHGVGQGLVGYSFGAQLRHVLASMGAAIVISIGYFLSENPPPALVDDDDTPTDATKGPS